jgi:hypothetical protein
MVKYLQIKRSFTDKNNYLKISDTEALKYRYQTGLETLVVYTINDEY